MYVLWYYFFFLKNIFELNCLVILAGGGLAGVAGAVEVVVAVIYRGVG